MDSLTGYRKMNIFFFGNEEEKKAFYLECICPFMEANRKGKYYATRDWNGGPNTEVVYAGEPIDQKALRREIHRFCREKELSWKRPTTYTVLRKLCEKGLLQNREGIVSSLVSREEFYSAKSEQIIEDSYQGSLPAFVASFISRKNISAEEADEIQRMIDSFRKEG